MEEGRSAETRLRDIWGLTALGLGKVPIGILEKTVLKLSGAPSEELALGAKAGVDFAAVKLGGRYLICSSDPVTGVSARVGTYAVHVSANDVATSGNRPRYMESVVLLPQGAGEGLLGQIAGDIHATARSLGISIVGGHTEVTPRLRSPIVVMTAFAVARRFVSAAMARAGDSVMMTKTAGVEGTAVLAGSSDASGRLSPHTIRRAEGFMRKLSVVKEAEAAFRSGEVRAMHDCTEGGVLGAVFEMSVASGVGFRLEREAIPVARETSAICEELGVDPVRLVGSGSLILSVKKGREDAVVLALEGICQVTKVGEFTGGRRTFVEGGREAAVKGAPEDELWKALRRGRQLP